MPHYSQQVMGALRRFGINRAVALEAMQEADEWRQRIHRGWQPRTRAADPHSDGDDSSEDSPDIGGDAAPPGRRGWPVPADFLKTYRSAQLRHCPHCAHVAPMQTWLAAHIRHHHPGATLPADLLRTEQNRAKVARYRAGKRRRAEASASSAAAAAAPLPPALQRVGPGLSAPPAAPGATAPAPASHGAPVPSAIPPTGIG